MPDRNVFFGEGEKGREGRRRERESGRIMKCKNRDKKKMGRYAAAAEVT